MLTIVLGVIAVWMAWETAADIRDREWGGAILAATASVAFGIAAAASAAV